jgi:hypothetical protein
MKRWLLALAVIAIVAVLAWRDETPAARARVEPVVVETRATPAPMMPITVAHAVTPNPELGVAGLSTDDPLTAYLKQNVYPPTSRPLTAEHVDLLAPNQRHELPRPTDARDGTELTFTADRYFVVGDETITPKLTLVKNGKPVPYRVTQAFVSVLDPRSTADSPRYPFTLGEPFAPNTIPVARQAAIGLFVELVFGNITQRARIEFQYTPAAGIPARFTGQFRDALENGSIVVRAEVEVVRAGRYLIDCNLFDASDRPIAWTRAKAELRAGKQDVALVFFGKVLVDQEASGRFHIGQLRGARHAPALDPDLEQMPAYAGSYTTRAFEAAEFSGAEYDSAQKQEMVKFLMAQRVSGVHRGAAR